MIKKCIGYTVLTSPIWLATLAAYIMIGWQALVAIATCVLMVLLVVGAMVIGINLIED